jgi:drug/metabolite transporter (DMT)-like permease
MAAVSAVGSAAAALAIPGQRFVPPRDGATWACLLAAGAAACCVQALATAALHRVAAAATTAVNYSGVVWALAWDALFFAHTPDALALAGAAFVCSTSAFLICGAGAGAGGGVSGAAGNEEGGGETAPLVALAPARRRSRDVP